MIFFRNFVNSPVWCRRWREVMTLLLAVSNAANPVVVPRQT